jgi:hypothetical protein
MRIFMFAFILTAAVNGSVAHGKFREVSIDFPNVVDAFATMEIVVFEYRKNVNNSGLYEMSDVEFLSFTNAIGSLGRCVEARFAVKTECRLDRHTLIQTCFPRVLGSSMRPTQFEFVEQGVIGVSIDKHDAARVKVEERSGGRILATFQWDKAEQEVCLITERKVVWSTVPKRPESLLALAKERRALDEKAKIEAEESRKRQEAERQSDEAEEEARQAAVEERQRQNQFEGYIRSLSPPNQGQVRGNGSTSAPGIR